MANLAETPSFDPVPQIETDTVWKGGVDGPANNQGKALANRTRYLKNEVDSLGTGKQDTDPLLDAIAALVTAADKMAYFTGPNTVGMTALTAFARTLLAGVDAAAIRALLNAVSQAELAAAIAGLVNSSPAALDTLNELAAALGNDANFATTMTNILALKAALASPVFTGAPTAPTPSQFDASTKLATTSFVQRALGNFADAGVISGATTLTAADCGKAIRCGNGGYVVTLPLISAVNPGSCLLVKNTGTGPITFARQGSDLISVSGGIQTSITLGMGDSMLLVRSGVDWSVMAGSAELAYSSLFGSLLAANGYQKLPGGRLEVQGTFIAAATPGAAVAVTFPLEGTNIRNLILTPMSTGTSAISAWFDSPTGSGFNGHCSVASATVHYRAILD